MSVEDVHPVSVGVTDQRLDAYDTAAAILEERNPHGVLTVLASRTLHELDAAWAAVVDAEDRMVIAAAGRPPAAPWLVSHIGDTAIPGPQDRDIAWIHLAAWDLTLIVGRPTWPFGAREQARLRSLARLADARWVDLSERDARLSHPSCTG